MLCWRLPRNCILCYKCNPVLCSTTRAAAICCVIVFKQARTEAAARAVLEAAKKAGSAGELLSQRDLQAIFQQAMNPRKEAPAKVCKGLGV
jgi:hypothetical protein